jgi:phosphoglycerate kinase
MGLTKKTLRDLDPSGKKVFVRVDFNVPLEDGVVGDDTRIRAALPTLKHLLDNGAAVIAASHLGRPKGQVVESLRMAPVATRLQELLGPEYPVKTVTAVRGSEVQAAASALQSGELLLLENLRFEPGETENDAELSQELAALADMFVQDAFGTCHRAHASTAGVPDRCKPAVAGFLLEKEIQAFELAMGRPEQPFVAVIGGAKVSDKIVALEALLEKVDCLMIGGGMAYTFLKAQGHAIGSSLCEEERLDTAREVLAEAVARSVELILPSDHVVADQFSAKAQIKIVEGDIPDGWMGLDIGPATQAAFAAKLAEARTVVWNGPMGVFELEPFSHGTSAVANALAESQAISVVGGGDSVAAVKKNQVEDRISHLSTGGGAFLELLEGKEMPGISHLDDAGTK